MTDEKAYVLKQVQVRLRLAEAEPLYSTEEISTPEKAAQVMAEAMADLDREYFCIVNLDSRNRAINYQTAKIDLDGQAGDFRVLNFNVVSIGDINQAVVPVQNVFKSAILSNATSIMLLHNHPSGNLSPSKEDIEVTQKLSEAGMLMNIPVLDHIIVGGGTAKRYSLRENRPELFKAGESRIVYAVHDSEPAKSYQSGGQTQKEALDEITKRLEEGIRNVFESDNFKEYLRVMSRFHNYSFNNTVLIALQKPDASYCAGFKAWQYKFGRHVKKGEKGIRIIAPAPVKVKRETEELDPQTNLPVIGADGLPVMKEEEIKIPRFKVSTVFDVGQTEGRPLPDLGVKELTGSVEGYEAFMEGIREVSPVPIRFDVIDGGAKGYYDNSAKEIVINEGMSQSQTMKTAVHEVSHSLLHDKDRMKEQGILKDAHVRELEAESTAFIVCDHFGLDTSDYSFPYLASWSPDQDLQTLRDSGNTIRKTASGIITGIEDKLSALQKEQEALLDNPFEKESSYRIYQLKDDIPDGSIPRFMGMDYLKEKNISVDQGMYQMVYSGELEGYRGDTPGMLERLYEKFNIDHPEDFRGHSMSVSDVVVVSREGKEQAFYVDSVGFQELPDFFKEHEKQRQAEGPEETPRRKDSVLAALRKKQAEMRASGPDENRNNNRNKTAKKERGTAI